MTCMLISLNTLKYTILKLLDRKYAHGLAKFAKNFVECLSKQKTFYQTVLVVVVDMLSSEIFCNFQAVKILFKLNFSAYFLFLL